MYAIIKTGGKQYRVAEGDEITIEKLKGEEEAQNVEFSDVLAIENDGELTLGSPLVEGAKVVAEVVEVAKAPKVIVYKYKSKKDYRRKQGHRQPYMKVKITGINA